MYSPHASVAQRVLLIGLGERAPRELVDAWIAPHELPALVTALRGPLAPGAPYRRAAASSPVEVLTGQCDAMFATAWRHAWTVDPSAFELWSRSGLVARADATGLASLAGGRPQRLEVGKVAAVVGWISADWTDRELRVEQHDGSHLVLASHWDSRPASDPIYDGIYLGADAAWLAAAARALAAVLGAPLRLHEAL